VPLGHDREPQPSTPVPVATASADTAGVKHIRQVPLPPALQPVTLTTEEAETLRRLADDPQQPTHAGRAMATANPSVLHPTGS
jgi:hypothetical protein